MIDAHDPKFKRFAISLCISVLIILLSLTLYIYQVTNLLKHDLVTPQCNQSDTAMVRGSWAALNYSLTPSHWASLSGFLNATCLSYQEQYAKNLSNV